MANEKNDAVIRIPALEIGKIKVRVVGITPLIVHRFSEKCKKQIEDKQRQKAATSKGKRDPKAEYNAARYTTQSGKDAIRGVAFKKAMVSACRHVSGVTMTLALGAFHVDEDLVVIKGKPRMREDFVRIGKTKDTADLRYRPEYKDWSCEFTVSFNKGSLSAEQVVNLLNIAGFHVGVGELRPELSGHRMGCFKVA